MGVVGAWVGYALGREWFWGWVRWVGTQEERCREGADCPSLSLFLLQCGLQHLRASTVGSLFAAGGVQQVPCTEQPKCCGTAGDGWRPCDWVVEACLPTQPIHSAGRWTTPRCRASRACRVSSAAGRWGDASPTAPYSRRWAHAKQGCRIERPGAWACSSWCLGLLAMRAVLARPACPLPPQRLP